MRFGIALPAEFRKMLEEEGRSTNTQGYSERATREPVSALRLPCFQWPDDPAVYATIANRLVDVAGGALSETQRRFLAFVRERATTNRRAQQLRLGA